MVTQSDSDDGKAQKEKDIWDKLAALSTLIGSVVIGGAGLWASHSFNEDELKVHRVENDAAIQLQTHKNNGEMQIEKTKELVELFPYLSSTDPAKADFGLTIYSDLGKEALALKLIKDRNDFAGAAVVQAALHSPNGTISNLATNVAPRFQPRSWLFPDGSTLNEARALSLTSWLKTQSAYPNLRDEPLEVFVSANDPQFDSARKLAVQTLAVPQLGNTAPCGTFTVKGIPSKTVDDVAGQYSKTVPAPIQVEKSPSAGGTWTVTAKYPLCR